MVSDEQSSPDQLPHSPTAFASDNPFSPNPDQFPHSPTALAIDFSKLPLFFAIGLLRAEGIIHRPLTPDETIALAYYEARSMAISDWAVPPGAVSLFHVRVNKKLKLTPFRIGAYGVLPTASIFTLAWFRTARGIAKDPRLRDYDVDLRAMRRGKSFTELMEQHRVVMEIKWAWRDQPSTLPDMDGTNDAGDKGMVGWDDIGEVKRGAQVKFQDTSPQPVPRSSPQSYRTAAEDHNPSSSTESDWSQESSDGGSAWERIRHGAGLPTSSKNERRGTTGGRGPGEWQQQREGSGSSGSDEFSFSSLEQERSYAQEEAQRDFGARVEKERQGGDFSEKSGRGRR